jgi:hypothetical protein
MIGAQEKPGSPLLLAATGPVDVLTINTPLNSPLKYGDVWWYFTAGKSFGFAPTSLLNQNDALGGDIRFVGETFPTKRLSWVLNGKLGGYRVGDKSDSNLLMNFRKVIYCI